MWLFAHEAQPAPGPGRGWLGSPRENGLSATWVSCRVRKLRTKAELSRAGTHIAVFLSAQHWLHGPLGGSHLNLQLGDLGRDTGRRNLATQVYQREVLLLRAHSSPFMLSLGCVCCMLVFKPSVYPCALCALIQPLGSLDPILLIPCPPAPHIPTLVSFSRPHPVLGLFPGLLIHPGKPSEAGDEGILDGSE